METGRPWASEKEGIGTSLLITAGGTPHTLHPHIQPSWAEGVPCTTCVWGHVSVEVGTRGWEDRVGGRDWRWGAMVCSHATLVPGYSVAVLHKAHGFSYVAGAPRHKLRGAVFELQKDRESTFVRQMEGEQVPPGEVTFPSVGALGPWGDGWMGPPWARSRLECNSVALISAQRSPSVETRLLTPNPL